MTTTAKKIKELESRIDSYQHTYMEALRGAREVLEQLKAEINPPKPPDPEPLECLVEFKGIKPIKLADGDSVIDNSVQMRQITPQMLENEKDAARYRYLKEKAAVVASSKAPIYMYSPYQWDEMIDKLLDEES